MTASGPRALLFDLDGTLVDSAVDIARALSTVRAARGGGPIDVATVRRLVSHGAATVVAKGLGAWADTPEADLAAFRTALRALAVDPAIVFPGVRHALERLADAGFLLAVVTNKPEQLARQLLEGLDLARSFGEIVGGDTAAAPKPDPAPLRLALQALGAEADAALMIGDSPIDAGAARACGVPFLLYSAGYDAAGCAEGEIHAQFDHFDGLPGLVSACFEYPGRRLRAALTF